MPEHWRRRVGIDDERVWPAEHPIRHVVRRAATPSNRLVVVFAAFPSGELGPRYTWFSVLRDQDWHRLFLLDDLGPLGCYYLGERRRLFVADAVAEVVAAVAAELGVAPRDIVAVGSSKGGWSALYAASRNGYGHVVAGAPQVRLGTFLIDEWPELAPVAELVAGGTADADRAWLDGLLFQAIDAAPTVPAVRVQTGHEDLEAHIRPLVDRLAVRGGECSVELAPYDGHRGVVSHFTPYLLRHVGEVVRG